MNDSASMDVGSHAKIEAMLPWYVNQTLELRERAEVRAHLVHCGSCRREVALQGRIRQHVRSNAQRLPAPADSLVPLMERIEAFEAGQLQRWRRRLGRWWRGGALERALLAQSAAIVLLAALLGWLVLRPEPPAEYHTLGASVQAPTSGLGYVELEPEDSLTVAQVQGLLQQIGGKIVDGPSERGVYIVEIESRESERRFSAKAAAAWLDAQPGVARATPLDQVGRRER
jgi:hypothetical protein